MADEKKVSLTQRGGEAEDHAAKVLREKIGDVRTIGARVDEAGTVIEGVVTADQKVLEGKVVEALRTVFDPEIPLNIYDLGLIYKLVIDPTNAVKVEMTLTAPGCGMGPAIAHDAQSKILTIDGIDEADVQLVWDPPWNQHMISEAGRMKLGMV